jgi:hypothetical protein
MPIIYLPRAIEATDGLELLAASFMMRLKEIEILLKRLADVKKNIHSDPSNKNLITISLRVVLISPTLCGETEQKEGGIFVTI